MKEFQLVAIVFAVALSMLACSGGGRSQIAGNVCSAKSNPTADFDQVPSKATKMDINETLPEGDYVYLGASLSYQNKNGFRIDVRDAKGEDSSVFGPSIGCVRNFAKAREGMGLSTPGISLMKIEVGGKATIEQKTFGFEMKNNRLVAIAEKNDEVPESPGKAYKDVQQKYILAYPKDIYEIRSYDDVDGNKYLLRVSFRRVYKKPTP